jgi:hypothetical protein
LPLTEIGMRRGAISGDLAGGARTSRPGPA